VEEMPLVSDFTAAPEENLSGSGELTSS